MRLCVAYIRQQLPDYFLWIRCHSPETKKIIMLVLGLLHKCTCLLTHSVYFKNIKMATKYKKKDYFKLRFLSSFCQIKHRSQNFKRTVMMFLNTMLNSYVPYTLHAGQCLCSWIHGNKNFWTDMLVYVGSSCANMTCTQTVRFGN